MSSDLKKFVICPHFEEGARLGNRLFQIAATYAHACRRGLTCQADWGYNEELQFLFDFLGRPAEIQQQFRQDIPVTYVEEGFTYSRIPDHVLCGSLAGYFQSERYFSDFRAEIRGLYRNLVALKKSGVAGIHIRRGDYLDRGDMYHSPDADFLTEAIAQISPGIDELVIFSDDPEAATDLVALLPGTSRFRIITDDQDALHALREMTAMQELILSCSTFSWWGAWLGAPSKVIIQRPWFVGGILDDKDLYLPDWVTINNHR